MRVLVIAQYFPPDMGGGATRAFNASLGLRKAGCDVTVVSAFPHYPSGNIPQGYRRKAFVLEATNGLRLIRTYVPPLASEGYAKRMVLFISFILSSMLSIPFLGKVDVIWAANPNITAMFPGIMISKVKKCPIAMNVDDLWPEALYDLGISKRSLIGRAGEILAKIAYRFASLVTPISPGYVKAVVSKYGIASNAIHVIKAGVNMESFQVSTDHQKRPLSRFRVLYIGAFSPAYDFRQVFDAAQELSKHDGIEIILQGGGEMASQLNRMQSEFGLPNVKVIEKIVSRVEVVEAMKDADVLLLPLSGYGSIELGISSKIYEYQAMGKPILCCSSGQPGIYVSKTNSGIVIKPGDYIALAESVLLLSENPSIVSSLGKSGRSFVERNLSIERIGEELKNVLGNVTRRYR
ncbi:MAG: glycosyltransferase WbuB [Candidatus Thorarchaeota archaeon]|nr:glycosyltransferase WbuB [Candidatus Thorarchaeota archaeon]